MSYFIGHYSALEYWRTHDRDAFKKVSQAKPRPGNAPYYSAIDTGLLDKHGIQTRPVHIVVAREQDRRPSANLKAHTWNGADRSYLKCDKDLYVSTPEACLAQIARGASLIRTIALGFELMGTYSVDPNHEATPLLERTSRTTPQKLGAYIERSAGVAGIKQLRRAAKHIIPGSASPMETKLAMLLCLPGSLGGYGLPKPQMNYPVEIEPANYWREARVFRCDLCWPKARIALEYDSDRFHAEAEKLNRDSVRRALLEQCGFHIVSVTQRQVYSETELERIAAILSRRIGRRCTANKEQFEKRFELRRELLQS